MHVDSFRASGDEDVGAMAPNPGQETDDEFQQQNFDSKHMLAETGSNVTCRPAPRIPTVGGGFYSPEASEPTQPPIDSLTYSIPEDEEATTVTGDGTDENDDDEGRTLNECFSSLDEDDIEEDEEDNEDWHNHKPSAILINNNSARSNTSGGSQNTSTLHPVAQGEEDDGEEDFSAEEEEGGVGERATIQRHVHPLWSMASCVDFEVESLCAESVRFERCHGFRHVDSDEETDREEDALDTECCEQGDEDEELEPTELQKEHSLGESRPMLHPSDTNFQTLYYIWLQQHFMKTKCLQNLRKRPKIRRRSKVTGHNRASLRLFPLELLKLALVQGQEENLPGEGPVSSIEEVGSSFLARFV